MSISIDKTEITYTNYLFLKEYKPIETKDADFAVEILQEFDCEDLYEKLISQGICPQCGKELVDFTIGYEKFEYQGVELPEPQSVLHCESCDRIYE